MKIPFNKPTYLGSEIKYIRQAIANRKFSGDGQFNKACSKLLAEQTKAKAVLTTSSCTHSLELAAMAIGIRKGDEVIMPSFTFTSTANAFVLQGAKIVFVDINPKTMNIDETKIEAAITKKTKAIVPVHYAGVACEMDEIMRLSKKYNLWAIEDAAQAILSGYKGKPLGSIGHIGCLSFHETKNIQCGEGGAILVNDKKLVKGIEVLREKGTNRSQFFRGQINKYEWIDRGSSYLLGELPAAFLHAQLVKAEEIIADRKNSWEKYYEFLLPLQENGIIDLPKIPEDCRQNYHIFYIKLKDQPERERLINYLKDNLIYAVFHYLPLHSSVAGKKYGFFSGEDTYTTKESERLLRLPLFYGLTKKEIERIVLIINKFYV